MARPRNDPFDAPTILAAIASGATERAAYEAYASAAGRPYARSTFHLLLRRAALDPPSLANGRLKPSLLVTPTIEADRRAERSPVKPKILSLSPGGGLRVRAGSLIVFDGAMTLTYSKAAKPPLAVVLSSAGGFVSVEAVRFCARANVAIVALDPAHTFLSIMSGAPKASAASLRAQVRADPLPIARAVVAAKIGAMQRAGALANVAPFLSALGCVSSIDHIRSVEAQASRGAWSNPPAMRWERGPIPPDWRAPWIMRTRLDAKGKRGARHPVNAMLNAAFAVTAGRLATYLAAAGSTLALTPLSAFGGLAGTHSRDLSGMMALRPPDKRHERQRQPIWFTAMQGYRRTARASPRK